MKKTYSNICKTLACDSLEANDDKVTLTTAQLDSIEADITAKYKEITTLSADVDRLTKANRDLEEKLKSSLLTPLTRLLMTRRTVAPTPKI